jgi:hypothetical protein
LTRIGRAPKRAILFRTIEPFAKIVANLVAPNGSGEKIEFLGAGQQVVVAGIHPDTGKSYSWHGGSPCEIAQGDLPYIREAEARALVHEIAEMLARDFGYVRAIERPHKSAPKNGTGAEASGGSEDWQYLLDRIRAGEFLHDSLRDLAAKLIASGMEPGAAVNFLRAQMDACSAAHDQRWKDRRAEIPRLVDSAENRKTKADEAAPVATPVEPADMAQTLEVFEKWLALPDKTPIYAALGTVAANLLPGDPVWLGLIGPPSSAKTEILNSIGAAPQSGASRIADHGRAALGHAEEVAGQRRTRWAAAADR